MSAPALATVSAGNPGLGPRTRIFELEPATGSSLSSHAEEVGVSQTQNCLSALLDEIRRGETELITHHGKPVAPVGPYHTAHLTVDEAPAALVQRGAILRRLLSTWIAS